VSNSNPTLENWRIDSSSILPSSQRALLHPRSGRVRRFQDYVRSPPTTRLSFSAEEGKLTREGKLTSWSPEYQVAALSQ
jgi:hypothetical protein